MGEDSVNFVGAFHDHLKEEGLIQIRMEGDGNCFFRAVARVVFLSEDLHHILREGCCSYMETNRGRFESLMIDGQTINDYIEQMKNDATWGGEAELVAISCMYNVQFRIHDEVAKRSFILRGSEEQARGVPLYHLAFVSASHYNALVTVGTDEADEGANLIQPVTGRARTDQETSKLRSYIRRFLQLIWNRTIDKKRILIMCTPKHLPGNTVIEKLRNPNNIETTVLYSFNFTGSTFLEHLCADETLNEDWDVFYKVVLPEIGVYNQREWIAKLGVYYILHTNMDHPINNIRFECFFDVYTNAVMTNSIIRHLDVVKSEMEEMLPKLEENKLFCLDECTDNCTTNQFPGHFSLINMEPFPMYPEGDLKDYLSDWLFKDDYAGLRGHRLQPLLTPNPAFWNVEELANSVKMVLDRTSVSNDLSEIFNVYILLLVTTKDAGIAPSEGNIWTHWNNRTADFAVYVGCTIQKIFRLAHARIGDPHSPVSAMITPSSSLFIVYTKEFADYSLARQEEAMLIALCMLYKTLKGKTNRNEDYKLINQVNENMWFCPVNEETIDICVNVMGSNWRLFRFKEESFCTTPENEKYGNFVILEQYPIQYLRHFQQVP